MQELQRISDKTADFCRLKGKIYSKQVYTHRFSPPKQAIYMLTGIEKIFNLEYSQPFKPRKSRIKQKKCITQK